MTPHVAVVPLNALPDAPPQTPIAVPPSKNSTLPVGVPEPGAVTDTVAVYVTACPTTDGLPVVDTTAVDVDALFTVWPPDKVPVLVEKSDASVNTAVTTWFPTDRLDVAPLLATPPDNTTADPKSDPSILNWTEPDGVPEPGATADTVAVNVTACPTTDGL